jgi:hypothetical protein
LPVVSGKSLVLVNCHLVYRFFYGAVADVSLYQQRGNKKSETEATKERRTKATGNTEKAKQDLDRYSTM